jgi:hypothetical protein
MEPIAIIGLALRFSGDAVSEEGFWKVMIEKRCTKTEWPQSRINVDAFHDKSNPSKSAVRPNVTHSAGTLPLTSCATRSPPEVPIFFQKIQHYSTRLFSPSATMRHPHLIRNNVFFLRLRTKHWKMVCR